MASSTYATIASIVVKVVADTPYEEEPDLRGDFVRADDGSIQTSERTPKRKFACVLKFTPAEFDTFRAAISATGQPGVPKAVTVASPADGLTRGTTLTGYCRLGRAQSKSTGAGASKTNAWFAPLTVVEA